MLRRFTLLVALFAVTTSTAVAQEADDAMAAPEAYPEFVTNGDTAQHTPVATEPSA